MSTDPIPVRLSPDLQQRVDRLCAKLELSRSAILRLAVGQWLDAVDIHGLNPLAPRVETVSIGHMENSLKKASTKCH